MLCHKQNLVRLATLLVIAASLVVSAGHVVHAHVDGKHAHRLRTACDHDFHVEPVAWHAHVWLFGWEMHILVADADDLDSPHPPGDMSPSWLDMPTVIDVQPLATFGVEASLLDCVADVVLLPQSPLEASDDCPPHSGLSPGSGRRIWMSSLTL